MSEKDPNIPSSIGDVIKGLGGIEKATAAGLIVSIFRTNYERFREGEDRIILLYRTDLIQGRGSLMRTRSQIIVRSDRLLLLDYGDMYTRLIKVFSNDLDGSEHPTGTKIDDPRPDTKSLRRFIEQNPGAKVKSEYSTWRLLTDKSERQLIIRDRVINPQTERPLAESWRAVRIGSEDTL